MKCYIPKSPEYPVRTLLFVPLVLAMILSFSSCHPPRANREGANMGQANKDVDKPKIDTVKVLNTLDLYRAKRYEGIQEALNAGPDSVFKLVLYGRNLESLSSDIGKFTYLASLDISHNELNELPEEIADLHYLQGLYATHNRLISFPEQILLLPVLMKLDLSANQIREIPSEIGRMDQLTRLTLDRNTLTSIPVELYQLSILNVLELADNGITGIPEGISNLKALEKLDLSGNQLTALPREIASLAGSLKELNIQGNRISQEEAKWFSEAMPETRIRY